MLDGLAIAIVMQKDYNAKGNVYIFEQLLMPWPDSSKNIVKAVSRKLK